MICSKTSHNFLFLSAVGFPANENIRANCLLFFANFFAIAKMNFAKGSKNTAEFCEKKICFNFAENLKCFFFAKFRINFKVNMQYYREKKCEITRNTRNFLCFFPRNRLTRHLPKKAKKNISTECEKYKIFGEKKNFFVKRFPHLAGNPSHGRGLFLKSMSVEFIC